MGRGWLKVCVTAAMMHGCVATHPADDNRRKSGWSVGCQSKHFDAYGKFVEGAKCWATLSETDPKYSIQEYIGRPMLVSRMFVVDSSGPRLVKNKALDTDLCGDHPKRVAVDGVRIDRMPMKDQIARVVNGKRIVRERDNPWPYCAVFDETASLTGAKEAYDQMMMMWNSGAYQ